MARDKNFLLGQGERLAGPADYHSGGDTKKPPYEFGDAKRRFAQRAKRTSDELQLIPDDACPDDEVVAVMTLHPRYLSKTDFPSKLLSTVGLRPVGSRPRMVKPESWGTVKHPEESMTDDVFVAGTKAAFRRLATDLPSWQPNHPGAAQLARIEDFAPFRDDEKLRSIPSEPGDVLLEVVLHNAGQSSVVRSFGEYAKAHGATAAMERSLYAKGLTFVPVRAPREAAGEIAKYAFVRVVRGMPTLRPLEPSITRDVVDRVELPTEGPLDPSVHVAVFDGGIPESARSLLSPWVSVIDAGDVGEAHEGYERHGLAVTSALLFGPLDSTQPAPRPLCHVDHYRVLDTTTGQAGLDANDVLERILKVLDTTNGKYRFIGLSLGPDLACTDDEVTAWTALLDSRLVGGRTLACVAAGNGGDRSRSAGLNRVQPPADGVNVLAVGACDRKDGEWQRADYSSMGPGRTPGRIKPDGVAFGGCDNEPFVVVSPMLSPNGLTGTSFAAPYALRTCASVAAQLGTALNPLAVRALAVHRADQGPHDCVEVGWGRFEVDPQRLITCEDDETLVVYQGALQPAQYLRAPVPVPREPLAGMVTLAATLVIAPEVDPEYPDAYTRGGLEVHFRPNADRFTTYSDGRTSHHPKTSPFFSAKNLYGASEHAYRDDGLKWETCLHHAKTYRAASLRSPLFDIYYHHRQSAAPVETPLPIPYALVVSLRAPRMPDLYNQVVRTYANVLVPIRPQLQIRLKA